jgi:tetratricopeptide (TPR) repeat protein
VSLELQQSIIRIHGPDGRPCGAGFLVTEREALTCAHVVGAALGVDADTDQGPAESITIDFPHIHAEERRSITASVVLWLPRAVDGDGDIAVLRLTEDPPVGARPARLVIADELWGHEFRAFGFPTGFDAGRWASGRLLASQGTRWIEIEDVKAQGQRVQEGYSGGPVWDDQLYGVAGMIVAASKRAEEKAAWVIPVTVLAESWEDLKSRTVSFLADAEEIAHTSAPSAPYVISGLQDRLLRLRGANIMVLPREESMTPRQLPPDVAHFIGRHHSRQRIAEVLRESRAARTTPAIVSITGPPGVGKSALAIHAAHQAKEGFPDGQLYADLTGRDGRPLTSASVMATLLRGLGHHDDVDVGTAIDQQPRYRSSLAGKRVLIVLDGAHSTDQVKNLIPAEPFCAVLVTSREQLMIDGAQVEPLRVLSRDEALALLGAMVGSERIQDEAASAASIVDACGGLPLALKLVGMKLVAKPHQLLRDYLAELSDQAQPFDRRFGDFGPIWSTIALATTDLSPLDARIFRHLGLLTAPSFTPELVAALADTDVSAARNALSKMVTAVLVEPSKGDRYQFTHDLTRAYAKERLGHVESPVEQQEARTRVATWYVGRLQQAAWALGTEAVKPPPASAGRELADRRDLQHVLHWFDAEYENIVAAIENAHATQAWELIASLAEQLAPFFEIRRTILDWERIHAMALDAARRLGDRGREAELLLGLSRSQARPDEGALEVANRALELSRELGDLALQGRALSVLSMGYARLGKSTEAIRAGEQALFLTRELGQERDEARALINLGLCYGKQRKWQEATQACRNAVQVAQGQSDLPLECTALTSLAICYIGSGTWSNRSLQTCQQALERARQLGDQEAICTALAYLGLSYASLGRWNAAARTGKEALALARLSGSRMLEYTALTNLGLAYKKTSRVAPYFAAVVFAFLPAPLRVIKNRAGSIIKLGQRAGVFGSKAARKMLGEALELGRELGSRTDEAVLLFHIAVCEYDNDEKSPETFQALEHALSTSRELGDRYVECQALAYLGHAYTWRGRYKEAIGCYEPALDIARELEDQRLVFSIQTRLSLCRYLYEVPKQALINLWQRQVANKMRQWWPEESDEVRLEKAMLGSKDAKGWLGRARERLDDARDQIPPSTQVVRSAGGRFKKAADRLRKDKSDPSTGT